MALEEGRGQPLWLIKGLSVIGRGHVRKMGREREVFLERVSFISWIDSHLWFDACYHESCEGEVIIEELAEHGADYEGREEFALPDEDVAEDHHQVWGVHIRIGGGVRVGRLGRMRYLKIQVWSYCKSDESGSWRRSIWNIIARSLRRYGSNSRNFRPFIFWGPKISSPIH